MSARRGPGDETRASQVQAAGRHADESHDTPTGYDRQRATERLEQLDNLIEAAEEATRRASEAHERYLRTEDPADLDDAEHERSLRERAVAEAVTGWDLVGRPDSHAERARALPGFERWAAEAAVDPETAEAFAQLARTERTSWAPVDLSDALAGVDVDPPALWQRSDGERFVYAGRTHWFQGESESCKSMAAQAVAAEVIQAGGDVLYVDFEDDDRGVVARLRAMGLSVDQIASHVTYVRPDEALTDRRTGKVTAAQLDLQAVLDSRSFTLAVLDGVTEAMTLEGLELNSNADIAAWIRALPKRIAATGAAVVVIDHVVKSTEAQGRYAIGGQHKLAGVTGAAYRFTTERPLARALGAEPVEGTVAVTVVKDRPGHVRGRTADGRVGTLELTSWPDGGLTVRLAAPGETTVRVDMVLVARILEFLTLYDGATSGRIEKEVTGKAEAIRSALRWMAEPGREWVRIERSGNAHRHHLTDAGRAELDTHGEAA